MENITTVEDLGKTWVYGDTKILGTVKRSEIANSSARGGAFRTAWIAKGARGAHIGTFETRREAIAQIVKAAS